MHPNPVFRAKSTIDGDDRALHETLIDEIGFGMIFAETPDGPRVAHTPLVSTGDGAVQFHLARGNALTKHLTGRNALLLVNGPDAYISSRWYEDRNTVPTWDFVALELEGPVRQMDEDGLTAMLDAATKRHEARTEGGTAWSMDELSDDKRRRLFSAIVGFEMEVRAWRDTMKLSQNKGETDRDSIIEGLEANGSSAVAQLMRTFAK